MGEHLDLQNMGQVMADRYYILPVVIVRATKANGFMKQSQKKQVKLIVPDRPGFGLSTFQENRQLLDWPDDVVELANALSIEQFSIFGLSGGGPHVLATTYKFPDRLKKAAIASGTASPEMPNKFSGMWPPVRLIFITAESIRKSTGFF